MINKIKQFTNRLISRILVFAMLIGVFIPVTANTSLGAGENKTAALKNFNFQVKQQGVIIPEDNKIDSEKDIRVEISFGIPVKGDNPLPDVVVNKGDYAEFDVSKEFGFIQPVEYPIQLKKGETLVGTARFETDPLTKAVKAKVVFDGIDKIYDGTMHNVTCSFSANFRYRKEGDLAKPGDHKVTILKKKYTVNVPETPITNTLTKTGTVNLKEKTVE